MKRISGIAYALALSIVLHGVGCSDDDSGGTVDSPTIVIDANDDSCEPASTRYASCAEACETDPLGCAEDLLAHLESDGFLARRVLNPTRLDGTTPVEQKPNVQTPMHGLFVPTWNNPQLNDAIEEAIMNPFDRIEMPPWSISAKLNNNPGVTDNSDPTQID